MQLKAYEIRLCTTHTKRHTLVGNLMATPPSLQTEKVHSHTSAPEGRELDQH